MSVPAGMRSEEEREVDGAGRRVGVVSAVTREGRGASLSAAFTVPSFSAVIARSKPDFSVFQCAGKHNRAKGVSAGGADV